jgi:HAD superfamily hydrolase (TIGR01509 family)
VIKLILFDLDGVITDTKEIHYRTLNNSILEVGEEYVITELEHVTKYDGLKTLHKLNLLTEEKNLSPDKHKQIYDKKQKLTLLEFAKITPDDDIVNIFENLRERGYLIGCCTNCIRRTALVALAKTGVIEYLDVIITNDDIKNSKPHPEIYWKAMSMMSCLPDETLIIEDSPQGLMAAHRSKAMVLRVKNSKDLTIDKINDILQQKKTMSKNIWRDEKLNIIIPMAGAGSRFEKAGYTFPKPLIDVRGKPMIQLVVESMNIQANFIYIVQKSHRQKYNLDTLLNLITPNCKIVEVDGLTEGAACTVLLAKDLINDDNQLITMNSDQYIDWDSTEFMYQMNEKGYDGSIMCFEATHPKWSFAKTNEVGMITEVAEKNPISNQATAGIYYWKRGSDFVKYAEQMIEKNIRVSNEFYVCPVYNEAIADNKKIYNYQILSKNMWGIGTPEDLKYYLENYNK